MFYLSININIFTIYCCLEFLLNLILEILYNLNTILCRSNYAYINENNIVLLCKLLIVIEFLI